MQSAMEQRWERRERYSTWDMWGCVWPPRSYSCSFCWREFRSAQALGGHMNVHRLDRARLKLEASSSSFGEEFDDKCNEVSIELRLGEPDSKRRKDSLGEDEVFSICKKMKNDAPPALALTLTCQAEELDLELRLGVPQNVHQPYHFGCI